ncbi:MULTISPECIES: low specificity L-threonine aldolase [unclassified Mesorhizobium]|uniref:threonine aldolase family protein n=1 Tax=unclassified Mesorhizobium TaxID=325217 RepID=UPI000F7536B1|nr:MULTISPECIES: low specificity L-threonine aldolase [unclassified Mesorhizobium]AZO66564.1 low specificity L-threonine aldolase [Mesorhizobium sp. M6A.T.Cr.TU.016.01.1.1]RVB71728.1 low specificity L-threonine aldolase [Mesorhizobium sp. M6A.T.Cr.TU.014.01.1.1]RWP51415.1 MAG: low specificity L-threonine aldolase [Mesorhizobium sp.]RWP71554.1 MAG: low specificity L-threonine aldolase [Mesorhizobium sp.]RWP94945.1 MAG: low specificity L-threonine aldolase [Mesorhizobium sp.]
MNFASDNWAGAHPSIAAGLSAHAGGFSTAYGDGALDQAVYQRFSEIFEREVAVFFVATGTAANSLSLTAYNKSGGISFCHRESHVIEDECGAPEYFTGGSRLYGVDGALGKIDPNSLERAVNRFAPEIVHSGRPMAVSITQSTEVGTIYTLNEIARISAIAKHHNLPLHMDGARFANALVALETSPAEMTWKRGVDILSFGGTKNGCWCAEAVVLFDLDRASELAFLRKRAAQLFSKSRFVAAQFEAYFKDGLWLDTALHANAKAARLAAAIEDSPSARLAWLPQANEVFAVMKKAEAERAQMAGAAFYDWHKPHDFDGHIGEDEALYRFVTSFATTAEEVDRFGRLIAG